MAEKCHFAHGPSELRKQTDPLPENTPIVNPSKVPTLAPLLPKDKMATNYKTTMCRYFEEGKICKYGENCSYAHGDHEIRTQMDNCRVLVSQQQPNSSQFEPMKNLGIAIRMRWHQMSILGERLFELYRKDALRVSKIKEARELLKEKKIDEASPILQRLVFDFDVDESEKRKLKDIFREAVKFAEKNIEIMQAQKAEPEGFQRSPQFLDAKYDKEIEDSLIIHNKFIAGDSSMFDAR